MVPDFQSLMLPSLLALSDGDAHRVSELRATLAERLKLTEDDLSEMLPSGTQPLFQNRLHWALWYLQQVAVTERVGRGVHRITERGRAILAKKPSRVDLRTLSQYPEFAKLNRRVPQDASPDEALPAAEPTLQTPEDRLATAYREHRRALEADVLERLLKVTPQRFEAIVIELLVAMGYGGSFADAAQRIGRTGDGGLDGIIKEDRLGLDAVYVQAKRWQNTVGRPEIQRFAGSLQGARARKGVFITTSEFSRDAHEYAAHIDTRIVLIDGTTLAQYLFDFDVGLRPEHSYAVKRVDEEFFDDA